MNWFKKNWQTVVIVILTTVLLVGGCSYNQRVDSYETKLKIKDDQLSDSIMVYKSRTGELRYQKQTLQTDIGNLEDNLDALGIDNDKLKDQIGRLKNLNSRLTADIETYKKIILSDTIDESNITVQDGEFKFEGTTNWSNEFISTVGKYTITGKYYNDSSTVSFSNIVFNEELEYLYSVGFTTITYWKRDSKLKFWQPKTLVTDIELTDPNATVTNMRSIEIKEPPKKFYEKPWFWLVVGGITGYAVK